MAPAGSFIRGPGPEARSESEQGRQREHLQLLAEASRLFAESTLDLPELMARLSDILVPSLADSCYVRRLTDDEQWVRTIVVRHRDPEMEAREREVTSALQPASEGLTGQIIRTGKPAFIPVVEAEKFREATAPQYRAQVSESRMASYVMVAMRARGKIVGALGVGRLDGRPSFTRDDLDMIQKLADRAALALATWDALQLLEAEKEASLSTEARFRTLAENAPDLIVRFDREGRHLYVNPRIARITGRAASEFIGRTSRELEMPEEIIAIRDEKLQEALRGGEVLYEFELDGLDGVRRYQAKLVPELGSDGLVASVLGIARDVTELSELARSRENALSSISTMAGRLGATVDLNGLLDALVLDAIKLVSAESGCAGLRMDGVLASKKYFRSGEAIPFDYKWPPGHGLAGWLLEEKVPYLTNDAINDARFARGLCDNFGVRSALSVPILDGQGEVIGFFELHNKIGRGGFTANDRDSLMAVSHTASIAIQSALALERARRAELEERRRSAELVDTLKELETFAYSVAHDLRGPVRAMDGYGQILLDDYGSILDEQGRELARRISVASRQMDRMIQDLLAYSRLSRENVPLGPTAIADVLASALDQMRGELMLRDARVDVDHPLPSVRGHSVVLGQALVNLLSNAVKFVGPGVRPQVRVRAEVHGDQVRIWVEDNGIGIAPEHQGRLFRVFERLHGPTVYPGTGIGLAIVRRASERMAGRVGLESEPGKGSRFWLELPGVDLGDPT